MRHRIGVALILLTVALGAAACGPGGGGPPGGGGQPGGGQPGAGQPGGSSVSVSVKEWGMTVGEVPSGAVTFVVKNDGAVEHNVVIKETQTRLDGIQPGQTKELRATLQPGTYTIVCDIAGHEEAGMHTTVTVK